MNFLKRFLNGCALVAISTAANAQLGRDEAALINAAQDCRVDEARQLIQRGTDLNGANSGGYTPLMMAANYGCTEVAEMLITAGADATARHPDFGTAADMAKMNRYAKIEALLADSGANSGLQIAQRAKASASSVSAKPQAPAQMRAKGSKAWPALGAYRVGQEVLFSGTAGKTWDRGTIKSFDPVYGYNIEGWTGSYDPFFVVGTEREPFWTEYFVGDWRVSVPMAMGSVTDGTYVYRTVSGGLRLPPLRISADGSYSWRVQQGSGERVIKGRWIPSPDGPGVILQNADRGAHWLVYNNSRTRSSLGETVILASECCTYYDGVRLK